MTAAVMFEQGLPAPYVGSRPFRIEQVDLDSPGSGGDPAADIPRYVGYYLAGKMPVDRIMSKSLSSEGLNSALDELARGTVIRQVLRPEAA